MTSNATEGTRFEMEFCRKLSEAGFWVHRFSQNHGGQQPADVIAMKAGGTYLIDCKVCHDSRFRFSRMEANQRGAMDKWLRCGGTNPKFALKDVKTGQIWMMDYQWAIARESNGMGSVPCLWHPMVMVGLDEWLGWIT